MKFRQFAGILAALLLAPCFVPAQQPGLPATPAADLAKGNPRDKLIVTTVAKVIDEAHLTRKKLDETASERMHKLFVEQFDPRKLYFLESDIAEFGAAHDKHAKFIADGDLTFPVHVYEVLLKRMAECNAWAQELAQEKFDFTKETTVILDSKAAPYAKTTAQAKELW